MAYGAQTSWSISAPSRRPLARERRCTFVTRCAGSPFGEVSGKSSASPFGKPSSRPFGGAGGGSPFGTGASSVDPFAAGETEPATPCHSSAAVHSSHPGTHPSIPTLHSASGNRSQGKGGAWGENSRKTRHGKLVEKADYRAWNDVEVFDVPSDLRRPGAEAVVEHVKFFGLEELFPSTGLQEKFNADAALRTAIRRGYSRRSVRPGPERER